MGNPITWGHELHKLSGTISPNAHDTRNRTLLMYAGGFGQMKTTEFILWHPNLDINRVDDTHKSALHHTCRKTSALIDWKSQDPNQAKIVEMIVHRGGYIDKRDYNGATPMMV